MSELYEIVIFTASIAKYAIPIIRKLDPYNLVSHRLFRSHCKLVSDQFIKDLSLIGRDLSKTIIIDNSSSAYLLQPDNAIPVESWFGDPADRALIKLSRLLTILSSAKDVRENLKVLISNHEVLDPRSVIGHHLLLQLEAFLCFACQ